MNIEPTIITSALIDALATLPSQSIDAVLSLVPVDEGKRNNQFTPRRPLDQTMVDELVGQLVRVSRGAIALIVIHAAEQWRDALDRHGLTTSQQTYMDCVDVIVASTTQVSLPPADTIVMRPLVDNLIALISEPEESILNFHGAPPLVSLAIKGAGRGLTAITATALQRRDLSDALNGIRPNNSLTPEQRNEIARRLTAGESRSSIGRRFGKRASLISSLARKAVA